MWHFKNYGPNVVVAFYSSENLCIQLWQEGPERLPSNVSERSCTVSEDRKGQGALFIIKGFCYLL